MLGIVCSTISYQGNIIVIVDDDVVVGTAIDIGVFVIDPGIVSIAISIVSSWLSATYLVGGTWQSNLIGCGRNVSHYGNPWAPSAGTCSCFMGITNYQIERTSLTKIIF